MPRRKTKTTSAKESGQEMGKRTKKVSLKVRVGETKKAARPTETEKPKREIESRELAAEATKHSAKLEREKKLIMWSGVSFFMVLIFAFWLFNVREIFNNGKGGASPAKEQQFNLEEITDRFNESMKEVRQNLSQFDSLATTSVSVSGPAATTSGELSQEEIRALKSRLEELENKLNSQASGTEAVR